MKNSKEFKKECVRKDFNGGVVHFKCSRKFPKNLLN